MAYIGTIGLKVLGDNRNEGAATVTLGFTHHGKRLDFDALRHGSRRVLVHDVAQRKHHIHEQRL